MVVCKNYDKRWKFNVDSCFEKLIGEVENWLF